ncbi:MAG: MBL fold metallo-hydrolase [Gemmatimonadota bacterium]|nr:MBL fold metallo-hydrolase [Gemmatimonadota bacterium]
MTVPHRRPDGRFFNPWPGIETHGLGDFLRWQLAKRAPGTEPAKDPGPALPLSSADPSFDVPRAADDALTVTWVGHSTFLIQAAGINILTDPVWSERASPVGFAGPKRWMSPGIRFEALPPIDIVLQSHNHYDHLDEPTVEKLATSHGEAQWIAPLGLRGWLEKRRVRVAAELDWWDEVTVGSATIGCTPAQHFSARSPFDRDMTLWCGYALRVESAARTHRIFFCGDSAYHPEFRAIGARHGPFDVACMPVGAYDPRWFMRQVHMDPEEAIQAYLDVTAPHETATTRFVPMHWGTFTLTDEPIGEPPQRARIAWNAASLPGDRFAQLKFGETLRVPR